MELNNTEMKMKHRLISFWNRWESQRNNGENLIHWMRVRIYLKRKHQMILRTRNQMVLHDI